MSTFLCVIPSISPSLTTSTALAEHSPYHSCDSAMENNDVPELEQSSYLFNCPPNCTCSLHTYSSPYVCDKCKNDFRSESDLELHVLLNLTNITCKDFTEPAKPKLASREKIICPACGLVRSKRNQPRHLKFHCEPRKTVPSLPKYPAPVAASYVLPKINSVTCRSSVRA